MENLIDVALGNAPADLVLRNAETVNVFSGEILRADIAVRDGYIAGVGDYNRGQKVVDLKGRYLLPGLIDSHIHIESSLLTPPGFAAVAAPHGTTAVVADPHEIVNVAGLDGLRYMEAASKGLPLDFFYMIPSCVPATHMETAGASMGPAEVEEGFRICPASPGLAELMNFPGVLYRDPGVLALIKAARDRGRRIDGHCPLLGGHGLNAYLGAGVSTDHESTGLEEAREKLRLGAKVIIRMGSAAQNLPALLPLVNRETWPNILWCSDDRHPGDLIREGELDNILRRAVAGGLDPVTAVRIATINPARHYVLKGLGGIAPGYRADLAVVEDLKHFRVLEVYKSGRLTAKDGALIDPVEQRDDANVRSAVILPDLGGRLELPAAPAGAKARVIVVEPDQIVTGSIYVDRAELDRAEDIKQVAVVERHGRNGNIGLGLVRGFGPLRGALASTVAHDSHNLILVGSSPSEMRAAAEAVAAMGGGLAVVYGGRVTASLPLPVAGLMSDMPAVEVDRLHNHLQKAAHEIGCVLPSPFMTMSFLALPVIPQLKITDQGLVDVERFEFTSLWA